MNFHIVFENFSADRWYQLFQRYQRHLLMKQNSVINLLIKVTKFSKKWKIWPKTFFLVFALPVGKFSNKHHYNLLKIPRIFCIWFFCPKWLFSKLSVLNFKLCIKVVALIKIMTVSKESLVLPQLSVSICAAFCVDNRARWHVKNEPEFELHFFQKRDVKNIVFLSSLAILLRQNCMQLKKAHIRGVSLKIFAVGSSVDLDNFSCLTKFATPKGNITFLLKISQLTMARKLSMFHFCLVLVDLFWKNLIVCNNGLPWEKCSTEVLIFFSNNLKVRHRQKCVRTRFIEKFVTLQKECIRNRTDT